MNQNIDPCTDFYQFTCGNYQSAHQQSYWVNSVNIFTELESTVFTKTVNFFTNLSSTNETPEVVQKAKYLYDACVDAEKLSELGFKPIVKYLKKLQLPVIPSLILNETSSVSDERTIDFWIETLAKIRKTFKFDILIKFEKFATEKNFWMIFLIKPDYKKVL